MRILNILSGLMVGFGLLLSSCTDDLDQMPVTETTSQNLHVSAMVQNVFTITKYKGVDPESGNGVDTAVYPRPRTYSVTVGLNF